MKSGARVLPGKIASKPLFRDPVFDGAADPIVVWNHSTNSWWMFYTNRRASLESLPGVSWLHATRLGVAESVDGGANWRYVGPVELPLGGTEDAHWAPDIVFADGTYHMFLSFVPGVHEDWSGSRFIHHLTSSDLVQWNWVSQLPLSSDRVIDASVCQLTPSRWRMFYKDEADRSAIHYAESQDLYEWVNKGRLVSDTPGEGPKAFLWKGVWWLITDIWDGLAVYSSGDALDWKRQESKLLDKPGTRLDDRVKGGHADVVVSDDRAYLFYFTHPGRHGPDAEKDTAEQRRTSIQVVELFIEAGRLVCDRDSETWINLVGPSSG